MFIISILHVDVSICDFVTCQNGGTCKEVENDYLCECQSSYEGKNCEIGKHILKVISLGAQIRFTDYVI